MKELTDLCDYVVVSLSSGGTGGAKSNGLQQYYTNQNALDKLLKTITKSRTNELGKIAAFEYEASINDDQDYLTSVKRQYQRQCVISKVQPIQIFIKIDPFQALGSESESLLLTRQMAKACLEYGIDGIVVDSQNKEYTQQNQVELIKAIREVDKERKLTVIAAGCNN